MTQRMNVPAFTMPASLNCPELLHHRERCSKPSQSFGVTASATIPCLSTPWKTLTGDGRERNEHVDADVIIWGTGFNPTKSFTNIFKLKNNSNDDNNEQDDDYNDGLYLYKYILHPKLLPNCYFIGFRDPAFNVPFMSNIQAIWAASCVSGFVKQLPPTTKQMIQSLKERQIDSRKHSPYTHRRAYFDYLLRYPKCQLSYVYDLIYDCFGGEKVVYDDLLLPTVTCHPMNIWSSASNLEVVVSTKFY